MRFQFSCQCSWRNGKCSYRTRTRTTRRTSRLLPHLIINLSHNRRRSHFLNSCRNFSRRVPSSETRACSEITARIGLCVYVIDARLKLSWPDADHVVITVLLLYLCSVFVKREGGTDFHHAENDLIHKYQINPTFLRVTKLLSSPLTDVRTHVGVIFIFYKSSFTSSLFNVPAVEGFPAVRMRDDILQRSGGRKEIKNKNGDERFLWDEVTSSAQTSLAWFHMRSADWTFWQPPLLRQRRNRFLRSVISDFRCGCGTMSSFPAQLLISYPEMSACRRWRMKTNHSPCKNWLNDRL